MKQNRTKPALPATGARVLILSPVLFAVGYGLLILWRPTRTVALLLLAENHVVELVTFATLLAGALLGFRLAIRAGRLRYGILPVAFFALFALGLFVTAMEEVAWGQVFFHYETPEFIGLNYQQEMTLHNLRGLHNRTEFLRLAFGLGGIAGVWLSRFRPLRKIAPPPVLLSWFVVIAVLAALDLHNDYSGIQPTFDQIVHCLAEVVEMMVGISGLLFVWLKTGMLREGRDS